MEEKFKYLDEINKKRYEIYENMEYLKSVKLKVTNIKNGTILPLKKNTPEALFGNGGVIDEKGEYIESSAQLAFGMKNRVLGKYEIEEKPVYVNKKVVYLNFFIHQWGHFLIDVISRLWYVLENKDENFDIVYTCTYGENDEFKGNYLEFFELLGIDVNRLIMINKPTCFKEVVIPDPSIYPGKYYTKEYKNIFRKIIDNVQLTENIPEKIYLSRKLLKTKFKKEVGEKEIEEFFNSNGYISIYPEQLTLKEQLQYFKYSKKIIATSGSLAHNVLFCDKNELTILNKTCLNNLHQHILNSVSDSKIKYIDVHLSYYPILYGYGPFLLILSKNLKKFSEDYGYKFSYPKNYKIKKIFRKIWYLCMYFLIYKLLNKKGEKSNINYDEIRKYYKRNDI